MKKILCILSVLTIGLTGQAQDKTKWGQAQLALQEGRYYTAVKLYEELLRVTTDNSDIWMEAGVAQYMMGTNKQGSLPYFENAMKHTKGDTIPELMLYMANAKHVNYDFDEAIWYANAFKRMVDPKDELIADANLLITQSGVGKQISAEKKEWEITNMGPKINSEYPDFRPVITLDQRLILFTARRLWKNGKNKGYLTEDSGNYFEDIYYSFKGKGDKWEESEMFEFNELTRNEATVGISGTGQDVLLYMDDNKGDGNIFSGKLIDKQLKEVTMLAGDINSKGWETHASYSPDGNTIYFTSDRKGGYGGRDIYKMSKLPNGSWGNLENLGPTINTKYDEESPFMASDAVTLYFSSNGETSMGGFDIFYSKRMGDGTWSNPVNMGYPLNTTDDDVFFVLGADGKTGYYSSNRQLRREDKFLMETYGDLDIYKIAFDKSYIEAAAILTGMVISPKGIPLTEGIELEVTRESDPDDISYFTPRVIDGGYIALLGPCDKFHVNILRDGESIYQFDQTTECKPGFQQFYKILMLNDGDNTVKTVIPDAPETVRFKIINSPKSLILTDVVDLNPRFSNDVRTVINIENMFFLYKKIDNPVYELQLENIDANIAMNTCIAILDTAGKIIGYAKYIEGSKYMADMNNLLPECPKSGYVAINNDSNGNNTTGIEPVSFKKMHGYNKYDVAKEAEDFRKFIEGTAKIAAARGFVEISIESSASKVRTKTFGTNDKLAKKRAEEAQLVIKEALIKAGVKEDQIRFAKVTALVQGPEYTLDYQNEAKYQPFQYVQASAK